MITKRHVVVAALIFAIAMLLVGTLAHSNKGDFWLVAFPGYLTGAGTLALGIVAYLTMLREAEDRRAAQKDAKDAREELRALQNQQDAERRARERRSQAEEVQVATPRHTGSIGPDHQFACAVENHSRLAIRDVVAVLVPRLELIDPDSGLTEPVYSQARDRLIPGESWKIQTTYRVAKYVRVAGEPMVWVFFTDDKGVEWVYDEEFNLRESTPSFQQAVLTWAAAGTGGAIPSLGD